MIEPVRRALFGVSRLAAVRRKIIAQVDVQTDSARVNRQWSQKLWANRQNGRRGVGRAFQGWSRRGSRRLPPSESSFLCPAIESPRLERVTDIGLHASASEGSKDGDRQLSVQRHILLCFRCARAPQTTARLRRPVASHCAVSRTPSDAIPPVQ